MAELVWDKAGEKLYETGVDRGVLYPQNEDGAYPKGVVWNGLISVSENPSGAEPSPLWADNIKYLSLVSAEELALTVEAYTYPKEFEACDGSASVIAGATIGQQSRSAFGFSYRTVVGNDIKKNDFGYKIHLVYGCTASPSERQFQTINDTPEAITFSWEFATTPVNVTGHKPTALLVIDSSKVENKDHLAALEKILWGSNSSEAMLPLPDQVVKILKDGQVG